VQRRRDPWAPFRIWIALTIGLYALRAAFVTTPLGAIPGFVLLLMVLVALLLAGLALLRPGRLQRWREGP
jgi:RsiW-degrading membrane proteinase PrsW (M82 family)